MPLISQPFLPSTPTSHTFYIRQFHEYARSETETIYTGPLKRFDVTIEDDRMEFTFWLNRPVFMHLQLVNRPVNGQFRIQTASKVELPLCRNDLPDTLSALDYGDSLAILVPLRRMAPAIREVQHIPHHHGPTGRQAQYRQDILAHYHAILLGQPHRKRPPPVTSAFPRLSMAA